MFKAVHRAVITSPAGDGSRLVDSAKVAHNVTVRIEDADLRNCRIRDVLLTAGLTQQALRRKSRRHVVIFVSQDRRQTAEVSITHSHDLDGPAKKKSMRTIDGRAG